MGRALLTEFDKTTPWRRPTHNLDIESPYEQVLGTEFRELHEGVQVAHRVPLTATGVAHVSCDGGAFALLMARVFRLPRIGDDQTVTLNISQRGSEFLWRRRFGSQEWSTVQRIEGNRIRERQGPVSLEFDVRRESDALHYRLTKARFGIVPLPIKIEVAVTGLEGGWEVRNTISSKLIGLNYTYRACLKPE